MKVETASKIANTLVFAETGKHLNTLQTAIFHGAWWGQKYEEIAEANYCSDTHVKMVGAALWEQLSQGLAEKVNKKNVRAVIERRGKQLKTKTCSESKIIDYFSIHIEESIATTTKLDLPDGQVKLDSKFYLQRPPIESQCYQTIIKPGSLIRIKAPRQMGKSSLMLRILAYASQQNYYTVTLDFRLADSKIFQDLDLLLKWFCVSIAKELGLPNKLAEYWDDIFGSKMSCKDYFENYLLASLDQPLVLALEEVDNIFPYPDLADDFFALLRSWHEEAKISQIWQKMRLILVHSTEVYIPLNINQSPFNVGLSIELPELTLSQVQDLALKHGLNIEQTQIEQLMQMLGGHPYLIRVALYHLVENKQNLEQVLSFKTTYTSPFSTHLRRHLRYFQEQPLLLKAWQTVLDVNSSTMLDSVEMFKLHSMGLIRFERNKIVPRCELYRQYFNDC
jgi:hypothetical protein